MRLAGHRNLSATPPPMPSLIKNQYHIEVPNKKLFGWAKRQEKEKVNRVKVKQASAGVRGER